MCLLDIALQGYLTEDKGKGGLETDRMLRHHCDMSLSENGDVWISGNFILPNKKQLKVWPRHSPWPGSDWQLELGMDGVMRGNPAKFLQHVVGRLLDHGESYQEVANMYDDTQRQQYTMTLWEKGGEGISGTRSQSYGDVRRVQVVRYDRHALEAWLMVEKL